MSKFKCNQCGQETVFQSGMTVCPHCQTSFDENQLAVMTESLDIDHSIDTTRAGATLAVPMQDEDESLTSGSSKTALAADLGYVDNPRHSRTLETSPAAYDSTSGKSSAIPSRTVAEDESDSEIKDYRLEGEIGQGSFGTVYRAIQVPLDRSVAIKLLKPLPMAPSTEGDQSKEARVQTESRIREEFLREAQFTGKLEHPNIVPIHDIGIVSGGKRTDRPFYVMKEIKGISWQDVLTEKTRDENLDIFGSVVDAIGFSHSRNILHCDLKPENVMLGEFGEVLVVDWGQAINTASLQTYRPGGTPAYCSPEMAQYWCDFAANPSRVPDSASLIGPRSDVYLLGAILFQLVTGRAPHFGLKGETPADVMRRAARNEVRRHEDFVDDELMQIALRTLRLSDQEHIVTVAQLQTELKAYEERKQSIDIRDRAFELLEKAKFTSDYDTYQKAKFGFEESLDLWEGNPTAKSGLQATRLSCAALALKDQNFDLGLGMMSEVDTEEEVKVKNKLVVGKRKRDRRKRLVFMLGLAFATAVVLGGGAVSYFGKKAIDETAKANTAKDELKDLEITSKKDLAALDLAKATAERTATEAEARRSEAEGLARDAEQKRKDAEQLASDANDKRVTAEGLKSAAEMAATDANQKAQAAEALKIEADAKAVAAKALADEAQGLVDAAQKNLLVVEQASKLLRYKTKVTSVEQKVNAGDFKAARDLLAVEANNASNPFEFVRLNLLAHPEIIDLSLYPDESLMGASLSGDRARIALCFADRIEVRDATDLQQLIATVKSAEIAAGEVQKMALSNDGQQLAIASGGVIRILETQSGAQKTQPLSAQSLAITDLGFSHDGNRLMSVGEPSKVNRAAKIEHELMVYERNGSEWRTLPSPEFKGFWPKPTTASFSRNGNRIVTSSPTAEPGNKKAFVLELTNGTFEWIRPWGDNDSPRRLKSGFVNSIFADDAGQTVISSFVNETSDAGIMNQVVVWDVDDAYVPPAPLSANQVALVQARTEDYPIFNPSRMVSVGVKIDSLDYDGQTLIAAGENKLLYWNELSNRDLRELNSATPESFGGHGRPIKVAAILDPGSKFITVSTGTNPEVLLTDTNTYRAETSTMYLNNQKVSDASSPSALFEAADQKRVVLANDQGLVAINSMDGEKGSTPELKWQVAAWNQHLATRQHLFALSNRDDLYRYDLQSGQLETILTGLSEIKTDQTNSQNKIISIAISNDSRFAVVQRENQKQEFEVWNLLDQSKRVISYQGKPGLEKTDELPILTISDDGNWIVGARIRFYAWLNDGTYLGDAGVEGNVKQPISSVKFFGGSSRIAVGRKGRLSTYDVSRELSEFDSYRIDDFPASVGKPNVVDAREIDGKRYLVIRKTFEGENKVIESGLDVIRLDEGQNVTVLKSIVGAQQGTITRSGKLLAVSLAAAFQEEPALIQFDIVGNQDLPPRSITVAGREVDGRKTDDRQIFSGVFETEGDDLVLQWSARNRQNTVTVNPTGELGNLCVVATPTVSMVGLSGDRAVTFENGNVRIWGLTYGDNPSVRPLGSIPGSFKLFKLSTDGSRAFAVTSQRQGILSMADGNWVDDRPAGVGTEVQAAAWSNDGTKIAIGFPDGKLAIWQGNDLELVSSKLAATPFSQIRFSDDGNSIVTVQGDNSPGSGTAHVVRKDAADAWISVQIRHLDQDSISTADISADGNRVVTGSKRGKVTLWNSESNVTTEAEKDSSERELLGLYRFLSSVRTVKFSAGDTAVISFETESPTNSVLVIPAK